MRAATLALLVALAGSCKTPEPPDSFGINVTVTIDPASRAGLAQVLFTATGAEDYAASVPASAFPDGTGKLHYIPGAHSGNLIIGATAQDGSGATLGAGNTGSVTIVDGHAVAASITITPSGSSMGDGGVDGSSGKNLGEMCGLDGECGSGHCVDGVCCGVASCGQCQNCGPAGSCVAVTGKDDTSGDMTCSGQKSCDASGMCKDRWVMIATDMTSSLGTSGVLCAGVGNLFFFQGYMHPTRSIDVSAATPAFITETQNTNAFAGFSGPFFPANGKLYYGGGTMDVLDPTMAPPRTWTALPASTNEHGEAAVAGIGTNIYVTGGRDSNGSSASKKLEIFNITAGTWGTGMDAPFGLGDTCGGTDGTTFYAFGGDAVIGTSSVTLAYDPTGNTWTRIMSDPPSGLFRCWAPMWRNKLAAPTFSGFRTFDLTSKTWDTTAQTPFPSALTGQKCMGVAGTPGEIYVVGDASTGTQVWKYNL